jgi:multicomponent Na+:H+ antiporter subunit E
MMARGVLFALLLAFWFALSDQTSPLFIGMGVGSALLVTWLMTPLVVQAVGGHHHAARLIPSRAVAIVVYLAWLVWSILASAAQVSWIVINPRVPPEPVMLRFRTGFDSRLARVILGNTISLVPGTMTVRLEGDEYWVHALYPTAVENLLDGRMQTRVARMFGDEGERAIDPRWEAPPEVRS